MLTAAARRAERDHDPERNADRLFRENAALVHFVLGRSFLRATAQEREELVAAGNYGLLLAVRRFDPARGVSLSTFATRYVWGSMTHWLRDTAFRGDSLDVPAPGREEGDGTLLETLSDPAAEFAPGVIERESAAALWAGVARSACLTRKQAEVLRLCAGEGLTQEAAAARLGVSRSAAGQLYSSALRRCRSAAERSGATPGTFVARVREAALMVRPSRPCPGRRVPKVLQLENFARVR